MFLFEPFLFVLRLWTGRLKREKFKKEIRKRITLLCPHSTRDAPARFWSAKRTRTEAGTEAGKGFFSPRDGAEEETGDGGDGGDGKEEEEGEGR